MLKYQKIDLTANEFRYFSNNFRSILDTIKSANSKYNKVILRRIKKFIPAGYICIIGSGINYNAQTKKKYVLILMIYKTNIFIFKPRPYGFP